MSKWITKRTKSFVRYMFNTIYNKIVATAMIGLGYVSTLVDGDATFFVTTLIFCVPLFLARRNMIRH